MDGRGSNHPGNNTLLPGYYPKDPVFLHTYLDLDLDLVLVLDLDLDLNLDLDLDEYVAMSSSDISATMF